LQIKGWIWREKGIFLELVGNRLTRLNIEHENYVGNHLLAIYDVLPAVPAASNQN
jgi:hypothetical protein